MTQCRPLGCKNMGPSSLHRRSPEDYRLIMLTCEKSLLERATLIFFLTANFEDLQFRGQLTYNSLQYLI